MHFFKTFLLSIFTVCLSASLSYAQTGFTADGGYQGVVGGVSRPEAPATNYSQTGVPQVQGTQPIKPPSYVVTSPAVPAPAAPMAPVAPVVAGQPVPATQAAPAQEKPVDPCAAYSTSYEVYTVCQDRMLKLQRMKDAQQQRIDRYKPAAPAAAEAPAAATPAPAAQAAPAQSAPAVNTNTQQHSMFR